jgi:3-oxoacyl-[acyl-carrier-protein] synthase II
MRTSGLSDEQRVVITGAGAVTPCGVGIEALLNAVLSGRSSLATVTLDDGRHVGGGSVDARWIERFGRRDPTIALALAASEQAVDGLPVEARRDLSVFAATGKPVMRLFERVHGEFLEHGPASIRADFLASVAPSAPADAIAEHLGCGGLRQAYVGACSTGLDCVAMAARFLRAGRGTRALAGSSEASLTPLTVAAFERVGVLASSEADAARAIRPYASDRSGFLIGEGAGVVLLETLSAAKARGAHVLAEVGGWGVVSHAHGRTSLAPDAAGIAHAITLALDMAGVEPDEVGHINAHGTATPINDVVETRGIHRALGDHAAKVKVCSTKPVTGHLLSASGSVELVITLGAMQRETAPPTINLAHPDPACDLDYTPRDAVACPMGHALVLNYGFGGHVGAVVLSQWTGR